MTLLPTNDLVVVAWLKGISYVGSNAATALPTDNSTWAASGFVQVVPVGGSAAAYLPVGQPVMSLDCWAANPGSGRPPWGKASQLAQQIWRHMMRTPELVARTVSLPTNYAGAYVYSAWPLTEPRRVPGDVADYARYSFDVEFRWRELS